MRTLVTRVEQTVFAHIDIECRTIHIPFQNPLHDRPHPVLDKHYFAGVLQHLLNGPEIPQRCIDRIVSIFHLIIGEIIGQNAVLFICAY